MAPSGGAATGAGGTAPAENTMTLALGGGLLLAALGSGAYTVRRTRARA